MEMFPEFTLIAALAQTMALQNQYILNAHVVEVLCVLSVLCVEVEGSEGLQSFACERGR